VSQVWEAAQISVAERQIVLLVSPVQLVAQLVVHVQV
jgi:hypothetical protein